MRYSLLLLTPLVLACAKKETPAADSATAMAAAPAALTEAQIGGTWKGGAKMAGSDSVVLHWTQVCGNGTCTGTNLEMPKDTIKATYRLDADSSIGTSAPYKDPTVKAMVIDNWIAKVSGNSVTGHGRLVLADKPDSVVMRYTFEGTRQ